MLFYRRLRTSTIYLIEFVILIIKEKGTRPKRVQFSLFFRHQTKMLNLDTAYTRLTCRTTKTINIILLAASPQRNLYYSLISQVITYKAWHDYSSVRTRHRRGARVTENAYLLPRKWYTNRISRAAFGSHFTGPRAG